MSTNILFVFEGENTEKIIVNSLENHFLKRNMIGNTIIKCAFAAEIYQLYRKIEEDTDFDTFNLIKERSSNNRELLKEYSREDFAEIYLFFDYDAHASLAGSKDQYGNPVKSGDQKLIDMLTLFDNETEKGKLYISYPMVEALRHIKDYNTFYELTVKCKGKNCQNIDDCKKKEDCLGEQNYREKLSKESIPQLCNINGYTNETWKQLIKVHLLKMNYIVNNIFEFPEVIEPQLDIFSKQLEKYINMPCPMVSVLSAFPVFIHDYFGNNITKELIY
jgi:hypothetical protein